MATGELAVNSDVGAFRTTCDFSHMSFDDPIVYPGQAGASHLHAFFGNTGTNSNSTAATLASTGNATCRGGTVNRTGYWVPAMIDTKDGSPVKPLYLSVYYKTGYLGVKPADVRAFPVGLRMIAGDPTATAETLWGPARFTCDAPGTGWPSTIPDCDAGPDHWLEMSVNFPQCWDGVNLDSPDHKSHMAYAGNGCPSTHPVALPAISMGVFYVVPEAHAALRWRLSSDNYDPKVPGGYSSHADWFNGWRPDIMDAWIKGCEDVSKDCHSHLLGDGRMIY